MSSSTPSAADALIGRIRRCIRQAGEAPDPVARHAQFYRIAQALKAEILAFAAAESDDDAVLRCMRALHEESTAFKHAHAIARLVYAPEVDMRYPFRDEASNPVVVATLQQFGRPDDGTRTYVADPVWPYLQADEASDARAMRYHSQIHCRAMLPTDLCDPREHALVGERGVFAVRDLEAGACLGVYGGRLMNAATYYACIDPTFVLSTTVDGIESWIDGENILAMANTAFAYEGERPARQAGAGYNMEAAVFHALSRCGRRFAIRAFFTTEPVAAGTELRWNYHYPQALIRQRFGAQPA
jgi:hypothetical protein